jgi:hypothetical protein
VCEGESVSFRGIHKAARARHSAADMLGCHWRGLRRDAVRRAPRGQADAGALDSVDDPRRLVMVVARALGMDGAVGTAGLSRLATPREARVIEIVPRGPPALVSAQMEQGTRCRRHHDDTGGS